MSRELFDRETILDLTVNFIPLGILGFFFALYLLRNPWGFDALYSTLQFGIIGGMFVMLTLLTYVSGKAIESDAREAGE